MMRSREGGGPGGFASDRPAEWPVVDWVTLGAEIFVLFRAPTVDHQGQVDASSFAVGYRRGAAVERGEMNILLSPSVVRDTAALNETGRLSCCWP